MRYPQGRLLVMAKAPLAGIAKTRLIPALGAEGAAILQRYLIERQLAEAVSAESAPIQLWCAEECLHPFFIECRERFGLTLHCQQGKDLGERLLYALESALSEADFTIVIGCDIPELNAEVLQEACVAMQQGADAVIVPAEDGGYTLLGIRRAEPLLFNQIDWGSNRVMAQTRERLHSLGWRWRELDALWDVDRPQDLSRLLRLEILPDRIQRMVAMALSQVDNRQRIK